MTSEIAGAISLADVRMETKPGRQYAFLIAVYQRREATRTYAVMAASAEAALDRVNSEALAEVNVVVVGRLSRDMARRLKLRPGDMQLL